MVDGHAEFRRYGKTSTDQPLGCLPEERNAISP
jgi:hypothetical protein